MHLAILTLIISCTRSLVGHCGQMHFINDYTCIVSTGRPMGFMAAASLLSATYSPQIYKTIIKKEWGFEFIYYLAEDIFMW